MRREGNCNIMEKNYECEMDYEEFEDMKRYNPSFTEDSIKGKTDEEIRTTFKDFYSKHLPVDLLVWMRVFEPKNIMNYKKGYWNQTVFIRDEVNRLFHPEYKEREANPVKVMAMHRSKSIILPVYYIYLKDYDTQIIMRNNFYDWKVSINSKYSITGIEEFFRKEKEPINPIYCEGFEESQVFGMYKENNKRFTIELPCNEYNLYTFFYMLKRSLEVYSGLVKNLILNKVSVDDIPEEIKEKILKEYAEDLFQEFRQIERFEGKIAFNDVIDILQIDEQ